MAARVPRHPEEPAPSRLSRRRGADLRDLSLDRVVRAIKPAAVRHFVWDASEAGFGIDVWPSGTRTWVLIYRALGVQRRMKLGSVDEMAPAAARKKAREAKRAVDEERDPLAERRDRKTVARAQETAKREAPTFGDAAEAYLETLRKKRSPRWAAEAERILRADILPKIGAELVALIGVRDVEKLHEAMHDRPFLANRAKAIISAVIARSIRDGDRPREFYNPAAQVENYPEPPRERALASAEWKALAAVWPKVREEYADLPEWDTRPSQLRAIEALALTGARAFAIIPRRVADVNLEARVVTVSPAHKHVTRVFLGSAAVRSFEPLVAGAERRAFLFPGQEREARESTHLATVTPAWSRLRALAKLEDVRLHDLRGSFSSVGTELGYSTFIIGGLLGHSAQGVTERHYTQRPDALLLAAADAISEEVARRLGFTKAPAKKK